MNSLADAGLSDVAVTAPTAGSHRRAGDLSTAFAMTPTVCSDSFPDVFRAVPVSSR
ncbi:hypothetical protein FMEAI12_4330035 [Parafrankia sp. Ea1.12]|nr:hypothetical protein FMEAI12_4330035 [Parafrankia sp. Ea1.12]